MKTTKLLLAILLMMVMTTAVKAQTYEYATVIYRVALTKKYLITISKEGKFEKEEGDVSEDIGRLNLSPIMQVINKMSKEGWEVYNSNVSFQPVSGITETYHTYLLRKK
jgi:hypothetical protein